LNDMLAAAGAIAAGGLEVRDPCDLATVRRCVPPAVLTLALLMAEVDVEYAERWAAAGTDWYARGALLHEALLFLLTPERRTDGPMTELELRYAWGDR
jgi:hypothetical protein